MREFEAEVTVADKKAVAERVVSLQLREVGGHELPAWQPGAHIDLIMPSGLVRQYSLCGDPGDALSWRIAVLRESDEQSRGGSRYVHETIERDAVLRIRGPRNHFQLTAAPRYVFVAGGIGITPILPMIAEAEAAGADWRLVYGGRSTDSMAFIDELSCYGGRIELWPQDERGLIDLAAAVGDPQEDTLVYCCGPQSLLAAVETHCVDWPSGSLRVERFSSGIANDANLVNRPFDLVLARQDLTVRVSAEQSVLEAVEEHGVRVLSSCRSGMCGTCETPVLGGTPEHRDDVLTREEQERNDCMMICVSRSRGETLVLDL
jgi:ferredoxin-NADP reductase